MAKKLRGTILRTPATLPPHIASHLENSCHLDGSCLATQFCCTTRASVTGVQPVDNKSNLHSHVHMERCAASHMSYVPVSGDGTLMASQHLVRLSCPPGQRCVIGVRNEGPQEVPSRTPRPRCLRSWATTCVIPTETTVNHMYSTGCNARQGSQPQALALPLSPPLSLSLSIFLFLSLSLSLPLPLPLSLSLSLPLSLSLALPICVSFSSSVCVSFDKHITTNKTTTVIPTQHKHGLQLSQPSMPY